MKQLFNFLIVVVAIAESSCNKELKHPEASSLIIVNAVAGAGRLATNFSGMNNLTYYSSATGVNYGVSSEFNAYRGPIQLGLYQYPVDTFIHSSPLFRLDLNLSASGMYSLFLTGTVSSPDTIFTTDYPPYYNRIDSSFGIRFVNLSAASNPVSVIVKRNAAGIDIGNGVSRLAYKGITDFQKYRAVTGDSTYKFEFRDAANNALIATYNMTNVNNGTGIPPALTTVNTIRNRNFTIALIGTPGGTGTVVQKTILINNY